MRQTETDETINCELRRHEWEDIARLAVREEGKAKRTKRAEPWKRIDRTVRRKLVIVREFLTVPMLRSDLELLAGVLPVYGKGNIARAIEMEIRHASGPKPVTTAPVVKKRRSA